MGKESTKSSENNNKRPSHKQTENAEGDLTEIDLTKLITKQQEACSIIEQKKSALVLHQLPYLEYIELQEEIGRLNNLRDSFQTKINSLRKHRKKQEG